MLCGFSQGSLRDIAEQLDIEDFPAPGVQRHLGVLGIFGKGPDPVYFLLDLLIHLLLVCVGQQFKTY